MLIIEAKGLSKFFGKHKALDNMDFRLEGNKIIGLIGRNGAGKTTLLNALAGRLNIEPEVLTINNYEVVSQNSIDNIAFARESCPYDEGKKLEQIIDMAVAFYPRWDTNLCETLLEAFELNKKSKVKKLSKGMRTMFSTLIALCSGAQLILLDEPTEGLDAMKRKLLYKCIIDAMKEDSRMMIISSHLLSEVEVLLEEIMLIDDGSVVFHEEMDYVRSAMVQLEGRTEDIHTVIEGKPVYRIAEINDKVKVGLLATDLEDADKDYINKKNIRMETVNAQDTCIYYPLLKGEVDYV